jgi:hypothetical protein
MILEPAQDADVGEAFRAAAAEGDADAGSGFWKKLRGP